MIPPYYSPLRGHPVLAAGAMAIVGACVWIWLSAERRALQGAGRIRKNKVGFQPCVATDVERFFSVVKSVRLQMSDGTVLRFRPMGKSDALILSNLSTTDSLSLAQDSESDAAILRTADGEATGSASAE